MLATPPVSRRAFRAESMCSFPPVRHMLAASIALSLSVPVAHAQQVVADGTTETPAPGEYATIGDAEHAFHALNGGSIAATGEVTLQTGGERAAAARAEGASSRIDLSGGSVLTTGYGAVGLSADSGGHIQVQGTRIGTSGTAASGISVTGGSLTADGVTVTTRGGGAHGITLNAGVVAVHDSAINVLGSSSHGLFVEGGSLLAENVTINHAGGGAGVWAQALGTGDITLRNVTINGTGGGAMGVMIGAGNTAMLHNVDISLTHARSGDGLLVGGEVQMYGGRIHAGGDNAAAISFGSRDGKVLLDGTDVYGKFGVLMMTDAQLTLRNSAVTSESTGINVNQRGGLVDIASSNITSRNGVGVLVLNDSAVSITGSSITAGGEFWQAISVMGGHTAVSDSVLRTLGDNGHGIYAEGGSGRPLIDATQVDVLTQGDRAIGAIARLGGSVNLLDSQVVTLGNAAHGVLAGGRGELTLYNTHVRAEGEDAYAAVINDNGRMTINGGSLVSTRHGGLWVRSTRDAGVTLGGGTVVSGGNGIGMALDAAVAGRFDVALQEGSQLLGDIVTTPDDVAAGLLPQSQVHVQLADGALWLGTSDLVQTLSLDAGSQWTLTSDARIGELEVRDSTVAISDGSGRFNMLTVDGDLHTERATLLFSGALGGDGSAIDRLHVRGGATGDAQVAVRNIGGVGGQTVDGIALIQVEGAALATYTLAGRAVGGTYEYFLHKGGLTDPSDGIWYLRSQLGDRCELDPAAPGCEVAPGPGPDPGEGSEGGEEGGGDPITPPVVLRPEGGAYLANLTAAQNMFALGYHHRHAGQNSGRGWVRVDGSRNGFDAVSRQLDIRGNNQSLAVGADLVRNDAGSAFGVMLAGGNASSTAVNGLTGYYTRGKVKGEALGVYGTWRAAHGDPYAGFYVDASVQRAQFRNRVEGVALTPERYDSKVWQGAVEAGYALRLGGDARGGLFLEPQLQVGYNRWDSLRHTEANGTVVTTRDADGIFGRAGVRLSGVTRWGNGAAQVQPFIAAHWLHQRAASSVLMDEERVDARIPRSRGEFSGGASVKFAGGVGVWGGLTLQRASGYHQTSAQMGVSYSW